MGRVGALAVALGVGIAVAGNPATAWADPARNPDNRSTDTAAATSDTTHTPNRVSDAADTEPTHTASTPSESTESESETTTGTTAATQSPRDTTPTDPVEPEAVIRGSVDVPAPGDTPPLLPSTTLPIPTLPIPEAPEATTAVTPSASPSATIDPTPATASPPSAAPTARSTAPQSLPASRAPLTTITADTDLPTAGPDTMRIPALDTNAPTLQLAAAMPNTVAALVAPTLAPAPANPIATLVAIPSAIISTALGLVDAVINAVLVPAPGTPPDSPLLWAVLAAVRRQLFNETPVAVNDVYTTSEDSVLNAPTGVLANDTDADADPMIATVLTGPAHGDLVFNPDGTFTYTPDAEFSGTDSFTYTVTDQTNGTHLHGVGGLLNLVTLGALSDPGHTATATASITVTAVDDAPVAVNDGATVAEDGDTIVIPVLANDTDIDSGPKTVTAVTQPANGTVTYTDTTVTYKPNANYNGTDTFSYTLNGDSSATVTVTVTAVDDAPVAVNDTAADGAIVAEDETVVIPVLANDTDIDAGPKTVTAVTQPANGTFTYTDTTVTYKPNANYNGTDTFSYTLNGDSSATVTVTVTAVDDAPIAVGETATVAEDSGTTVIPVLGNDTDIDGGPKTVTAVNQPANGTVTFTDSTVSYTPNANFNGTNTFSYTLNGGSTANVTVTVTPVYDAPVAVNDNVGATVPADGIIRISPLANDNNIDLGNTKIIAITQPANGAVTFADTTVSYTPKPDFFGTDTFTYTITGGSTATVSVTPIRRTVSTP